MNIKNITNIYIIATIHRGEVIHHHDQSTVLVNFNIRNTMNKSIVGDIEHPILSLIFLFILILSI